MRVGFVGLGVMGGPMALHLLGRGCPLTVWARAPEKARPLADAGASLAQTLGELAERVEAVVLCVNRSEDVLEVVEGLAPGLSPGKLLVDHSTISPTVARDLARRLAERGVHALDAPVTGGSMGAEAGTLTAFCGGSDAAYRLALPVMAAYTRRAELVGGPGAGQTMKVANQIAVSGALLGLCESLAFAHRAGLDLALTRELIASGAGGSWALENYGPKIVASDWRPGFSVANQRKDFAYVREAATEHDARVPGVELVDGLLAALEAEGHGDWATAALFEVLARGPSDP